MIPGEIFLGNGDIQANLNRPTLEITVVNTGDRPIQVGSHFHFFEVNRALQFDRGKAYGTRLNIPAGTAVRFEPGDDKTVRLVALGGSRRVFGLNNLTQGELDQERDRGQALARAAEQGFLKKESAS